MVAANRSLNKIVESFENLSLQKGDKKTSYHHFKSIEDVKELLGKKVYIQARVTKITEMKKHAFLHVDLKGDHFQCFCNKTVDVFWFRNFLDILSYFLTK